MNWPLVFIIGWSSLGVFVVGVLCARDRRREERELAEFREELRESFEDVCREMARKECEYRAKVEVAIWN